jgi:hypothetical protein
VQQTRQIVGDCPKCGGKIQLFTPVRNAVALADRLTPGRFGWAAMNSGWYLTSRAAFAPITMRRIDTA